MGRSKKCEKNDLMVSEPDISLGQFLEAMLEEAEWEDYVKHDPVGLVHPYPSKEQSVVALLVSCLAYGRVQLLRAAAAEALERLGPSPRQTLLDATEADLQERFHGFVYRMSKEADLVDLCWGIRTVLLEHETLENAYKATEGTHLQRATGWVAMIRAGRLREDMHRGFGYLLPSPADGSTTKRLHLFFRWMGRAADGVDLGLWPCLDPADLLMPLDTHTSRICRYLGLTQRKSNDLKTVVEITKALQAIDPVDPLRFDFPICHLGISQACIHVRSEETCPTCPLNEVCKLPWG